LSQRCSSLDQLADGEFLALLLVCELNLGFQPRRLYIENSIHGALSRLVHRFSDFLKVSQVPNRPLAHGDAFRLGCRQIQFCLEQQV
jgi:hypothetical protein